MKPITFLGAILLHCLFCWTMATGETPRLADDSAVPANAAAIVQWNEKDGTLRLSYDGKVLFEGKVSGKAEISNASKQDKQAITQTLTLSGSELRMEGSVFGSSELLAAETEGKAQKKFPLIRTSNGGPSRNLRNNALYDRQRDWMLAGPATATRIDPLANGQYRIICNGNSIELSFKPRFYQYHKNIGYFQPWTYKVRQDSITGWCSWWAYMKNFRQADLEKLLEVWKEKHLADYGYRFIQIDDCYQGGGDAGRKTLSSAQGLCGNPETWLKWRKEKFPGGMEGYVGAVKKAGFEPAVWLAVSYGDSGVVGQHPDWFVRNAKGKPFVGPWIGYAIDSTNPAARDTLIRPTYRGFKNAGFTYVKIDALRHYLYDNIHHNLEYCRKRGVSAADMFRGYLKTAREELGPETFILSCWGVLPESVGIADACRIGGDGYGPVTMQQYNSWNGIVWRNDPDHCDVYPKFKPAAVGNVTKIAAANAAPADTIIRPALASIAGCMLLLSDKPEVYRSDANLRGLRCAAPVLFSLPGQLYDFDDSKTRKLIDLPRTSITSGANPSPIDANQFGAVCPWWLNEFDRPFEHWNVLHRLNWSDKAVGQVNVKFADLGLDPQKRYLVYEFWTGKFMGSHREAIELPGLGAMGLRSYAIREQLDRPQVISTNRHLSQGGVDLVNVEWKDNTLRGQSKVIGGECYEIVVHVPGGYVFDSGEFDVKATILREDAILRIALTPLVTGEIGWAIKFKPAQ